MPWLYLQNLHLQICFANLPKPIRVSYLHEDEKLICMQKHVKAGRLPFYIFTFPNQFVGGQDKCRLSWNPFPEIVQDNCPKLFRQKFSICFGPNSLPRKIELKTKLCQFGAKLRLPRASLVIFDRVTYLFQGPKARQCLQEINSCNL